MPDGAKSNEAGRDFQGAVET
ncbi:hypothetical protein CUJ84_Chr003904 [Rhizobium leguminosarum]|uniref:Uncharacterized protein n=1 Tax=Rhizobium leguminosarum TaxID=384 RepID=A0A2K9Z7M9_RHILE|nr:hypothetical protein CUJ84_Chr003904 [Rhizobium leguminosarum]